MIWYLTSSSCYCYDAEYSSMYSGSKFLEHTSTIFSTFSLYTASISHTSLYYCIIIFYILAYIWNYVSFFNVWLFDCLYFKLRFCSFFLGSDSCPSEFMQAFVWYRITSMLLSRIFKQLLGLICSRNGSVFRGFWVKHILDWEYWLLTLWNLLWWSRLHSLWFGLQYAFPFVGWAQHW